MLTLYFIDRQREIHSLYLSRPHSSEHRAWTQRGARGATPRWPAEVGVIYLCAKNYREE